MSTKTTIAIIAATIIAAATAQQGPITIQPYLGAATNPSMPVGSIPNPYVVTSPQVQQLRTNHVHDAVIASAGGRYRDQSVRVAPESRTRGSAESMKTLQTVVPLPFFPGVGGALLVAYG
jgi:hypothetical protein